MRASLAVAAMILLTAGSAGASTVTLNGGSYQNYYGSPGNAAYVNNGDDVTANGTVFDGDVYVYNGTDYVLYPGIGFLNSSGSLTAIDCTFKGHSYSMKSYGSVTVRGGVDSSSSGMANFSGQMTITDGASVKNVQGWNGATTTVTGGSMVSGLVSGYYGCTSIITGGAEVAGGVSNTCGGNLLIDGGSRVGSVGSFGSTVINSGTILGGINSQLRIGGFDGDYTGSLNPTITINGGSVSGVIVNPHKTIYNTTNYNAHPTITINGGSFSGSGTGEVIYNGIGTVNIMGGAFAASTGDYQFTNKDTAFIRGGNLNSICNEGSISIYGRFAQYGALPSLPSALGGYYGSITGVLADGTSIQMSYLNMGTIYLLEAPVVPEPSSILALAGGVGCLIPLVRRRR